MCSKHSSTHSSTDVMFVNYCGHENTDVEPDCTEKCIEKIESIRSQLSPDPQHLPNLNNNPVLVSNY